MVCTSASCQGVLGLNLIAAPGVQTKFILVLVSFNSGYLASYWDTSLSFNLWPLLRVTEWTKLVWFGRRIDQFRICIFSHPSAISDRIFTNQKTKIDLIICWQKLEILTIVAQGPGFELPGYRALPPRSLCPSKCLMLQGIEKGAQMLYWSQSTLCVWPSQTLN